MVFKFSNNYYYLKRVFTSAIQGLFICVHICTHICVYTYICTHTYTYIYIFGGVGVYLKFLPISPREGPTWLCIRWRGS